MSCRPSVAALFPIILKASIEMGAAQSQDGVGSADGPEHSRLFKTTVEDAQAPDVWSSRLRTVTSPIAANGPRFPPAPKLRKKNLIKLGETRQPLTERAEGRPNRRARFR